MKFFINFIVFFNFYFLSAEYVSYKLPDTPVIISKNETSLIHNDEPYFPVNWYESYSQNGNYFANSRWTPYSPKFELASSNLKRNNTFERIGRLYKDGIATGIIQYINFENTKHIEIVEENILRYDLEFFLQIYDLDNRVTKPLDHFPHNYDVFNKNDRVHWYYSDDLSREWNAKNSKLISEILRKKNPDKLLMSCSRLYNYQGDESFILDYTDLIAPQFYPLGKHIYEDVNIFEEIPLFYNHTKFHQQLLEGKEVIINYNRSHLHKVYYLSTLASFHLNNEIGKYISRFPSYEEFRYQFYDSIICGAKGINIFCFYRSDHRSYENAKRIITEFRESGFEKAVLLGNYKPEIFNYDYLKINNDINDKYGKDLYDIDFCLYEGSECYYLIVSNNANLNNNVCFEIIQESIADLEEVYMDEKLMMQNIKVPFKENFFFLNMNPYEVKLIKIYRKT